jgi:hypothetical protein
VARATPAAITCCRCNPIAYDEYEQHVTTSLFFGPGPVFVVDRWCFPPICLSGWKEPVELRKSGPLLDALLFCWPPDLQLVPEAYFVQVDDSVRKVGDTPTRASTTTEPGNKCNPWDGVSMPMSLGKRILRTHGRGRTTK